MLLRGLAPVPPLCPLSCHGYDFSQGPSLIRRAEEETTHWLRRGGLERGQQDPRWALLPHLH